MQWKYSNILPNCELESETRLYIDYFSQDASSSPWTETLKQTSFLLPVITEKSLTLYNDWLKFNVDTVPRFDHAMAVTSFDLVNKGKRCLEKSLFSKRGPNI